MRDASIRDGASMWRSKSFQTMNIMASPTMILFCRTLGRLRMHWSNIVGPNPKPLFDPLPHGWIVTSTRCGDVNGSMISWPNGNVRSSDWYLVWDYHGWGVWFFSRRTVSKRSANGMKNFEAGDGMMI